WMRTTTSSRREWSKGRGSRSRVEARNAEGRTVDSPVRPSPLTLAPQPSPLFPSRPHHSLILRDAADALVGELLDPLALVGLGREDVALRVRRDRVHGEPHARLTTAVAELRDRLERLPIHHVDALVLAVGEIDVLLRRILRERDVPHRAVALRLWLDLL